MNDSISRKAAIEAVGQVLSFSLKYHMIEALSALPAVEGTTFPAGRMHALEAALWKVLAYDQLLRTISLPTGGGLLFAGQMPDVDAVYDDMIRTATGALSGKTRPSD